MPVLVEKPLPEMTERLRFLTDIVRPRAGEFRTWLADPRTEIVYSFRLPEARFAALEELIYDDVTADWTVPFWHERTRNIDLTVGQTVISVDTDADYRAGGTAMIWKGCEEYETATIDSVGSGTITLSSGLSASYDSAAVMPAHAAFLAAPVEVGRQNRGLIECTMTFQVRAHADLGATAWTTYQSREVLNCASGYLSRLDGMIIPNVEYVGGPFGPITLETARTTHDTLFAVELSDHAWDAKRFLHQVAGRDAPFWVKAWGGQLTVSAASSGASSVTVAATRPAADMNGRHIVIDGQYREIVSVTDNGASHDLSLSAVLSANVAAGAPTSLISLVRCDTDEFEIQHKHGFSSRISFPIIEERAA